MKTKILMENDINGSILDVGGGGEGIIGQIYGASVTIIDNKQEELDELSSSCKNCRKILMNAENLEFSDQIFDNTVFFYSLMYMDKKVQEKALEEAVRVTVRGGKIHIWDKDSEEVIPKLNIADILVETGEKNIGTTYGAVHNEHFCMNFLIKTMEDNNCSLIFKSSENSHFHMVFNRN